MENGTGNPPARAREDRLKIALKANLAKRKAQRQTREATDLSGKKPESAEQEANSNGRNPDQGR
ncbi:MAG: hypothetical protein AAFX00_02685 [Pseudomonadota bacterium]